MAQYYLLLHVMATTILYGVKGECEPDVIHRIVQSWGDNPPSDILSKMVGVYTLVWLSPQFISSNYKNVQCVASILDPDTTTGTTVYQYNDTRNFDFYAFRKTEASGKITIKSERLSDHLQYVISMNNHVITFYQCMPKDTSGQYMPFFGIAVDMEHLWNREAQEAGVAAKETLTSLGINTGDFITPCDPNDIDIVRRPSAIRMTKEVLILP